MMLALPGHLPVSTDVPWQLCVVTSMHSPSTPSLHPARLPLVSDKLAIRATSPKGTGTASTVVSNWMFVDALAQHANAKTSAIARIASILGKLFRVLFLYHHGTQNEHGSAESLSTNQKLMYYVLTQCVVVRVCGECEIDTLTKSAREEKKLRSKRHVRKPHNAPRRNVCVVKHLRTPCGVEIVRLAGLRAYPK